MEGAERVVKISVLWRGQKITVEMNSGASLQDFGNELQKVTDVKADTLRLIIPNFSGKSSKLLYPFSDEHSRLSLQEVSIDEGKAIRMMGVPEPEIDEILEGAKANLRIAGFEEEEKRLRRRMLGRHDGAIKLPQGPYIFADFRTLHIPGLELNPPASEALKRMHRLAADPGIVAIMNKHHWRVGIMTELAPVGYVGVSPKCILGFNKNHGEEISLRLRTDDLKGFRKYESIKKTLLHELAHMVYSEHDANFYALDKQLNEEAASLDWTKSQGRTLGRFRMGDVDDDEEYHFGDENKPLQKLGGDKSVQMASARASSVAAAYQRMATASINSDDSGFNGIETPNHEKLDFEPDPDDNADEQRNSINSDDSGFNGIETRINREKLNFEPYPDDNSDEQRNSEPDPDDSVKDETMEEPDPDAKEGKLDELEIVEKDGFDQEIKKHELSCSEPTQIGVTALEPDPDDSLRHHKQESEMHIEEPYLADQELALIQDPVTAFCNRMQKAIKMLQQEVNDPMEATKVLEMLVKIIGNAIQHPNELKFKRLRKGNPIIQRTIANHKAAVEILSLVGFSEDVIADEMGKVETFLVLKRNDPGLLWLAKSSIEAVISC